MSVKRAFLYLVLFIAAIARVSAADAPSIAGVAVDAQGLALPGVTVTVTPAAKPDAEPQLQVTDGEGRFTFDALEPGIYAVVLSLPGFDDKTFEQVAVPGASELSATLQVAGFSETVTVRPAPERVALPVVAAGEAVIAQQVLSEVPLANERFEDALPLLPGVVRGPDGLLNMNGARADQSAVLLNGINLSDPVTGHSAVRLPLEAIDTMNVHAGVYSAAFGNATGGVTDIVVRPGGDKFDFQVQNLMPRLRFNNGIEGFDAFTPRLRFSGPIEHGRVWYSQAMSYRFVRSQVNELAPRGEDEQKIHSFDSVTQIDAMLSRTNHLTATVVAFPSNIDNAGIDTLHPIAATPDMKQRGWIGAIGERAVLSDTVTLSSSVAVKQYNMNVAPKSDEASLVTVSGVRTNYFNQFDRDSKRYDASATLAIAVPEAWGQHLVRAGGQFARTSYDGVDSSLPVGLARADGTLFGRVDYFGSPRVGATNDELGGFIEDQWAVLPQLTLHGGVRYAYDQIGGEQTLAPRVDASYRPFEGGRTIVKGGIGRFNDRMPLNAADFASQQGRQITEFDASGRPSGTTIVSNRIAADGLRAPQSTAWNVEVDQLIASGYMARVGYRRTHGVNELVVDPRLDQGTLWLSSRGTSQANEFEATLRRTFSNQSHVTASYVRSSTKGDLNDFVSTFGDLRDPVIRADDYAPRSFDTPNRFLVWGVLTVPYAITVAPTVEYRSGFPYTVIDEQQQVVGSRNAERFPNLFTLDLAVTKDVQFTAKRRARVGIQFFNLTNHFNPQDVQNNTASPAFLGYANSVDRQVRTKFTLLF